MRTIALVLAGFTLLIFSNLQIAGQDATDDGLKKEVYHPRHVKDKEPVPYPSIRETDVMWEKTVWRMIDLRHKMNLPLYYPTQPIGERMSLISLLLFAIDNEGLQVYDPNDPNARNEFDVPMGKEQIEVAMDALADTQEIMQADGSFKTEIIPGRRKVEEIKQLLVKEKWFFDKQHSVMRVRVLGLCPIRLYRKDDNPNLLKEKTFWVYYPEARPMLASQPIFNRNNDAQQISYDDLFLQRRFDGYIFAESNVYNDRQINEYTVGIESLWEAERVRNKVFSMEHDLWEY